MQIPVHVHQLHVFLHDPPALRVSDDHPGNSEIRRLRCSCPRAILRSPPTTNPVPANTLQRLGGPFLPYGTMRSLFPFPRTLSICPSVHVRQIQPRQLAHAQPAAYSNSRIARSRGSNNHLPDAGRNSSRSPSAIPPVLVASSAAVAFPSFLAPASGLKPIHLFGRKHRRHALRQFRGSTSRAGFSFSRPSRTQY